MPQNNKTIIKERRKRVSDMYLAGMWQVEIAKEVGVTQGQVSQDLSVLRRLWQQSALVNIDKVKSKELAKLDRLENEYWKAWHSSVGEKVRTTESDGDKGHEIREEIKIDAGDPRFLQGVLSCISKRCDILGINAPSEVDIKSGGESIRPLNITVDSPETAEVLQKLIDGTKTNPDIQKE